MVNQDRLAKVFEWLVSIDSVSGEEYDICMELKRTLEEMGAETFIDNAADGVGGNSGNLIAKFKGNIDVPPLMLNAHMDTVEPGRGVVAVLTDGVFSSQGDTILGADDKSAIAIFLEAITLLQEKDLPHGPIELVLTVCEEVGLAGAKQLDMSRINAKYGFALDTTDKNGIVTRAPAANRIEIEVHGKDAHAGVAPENGINAIWLAAKALSELEIGRIDEETTCNIGVISGGQATNIVPSRVVLKGEVRSHDREKLYNVTETIKAAFERTVAEYQPQSISDGLPSVSMKIDPDFPLTNIPDDHPVVKIAQQAAVNLGRKIRAKTSGGGADANIFFNKGIVTGVLGTGMVDMHTVRESIRLQDMVELVELMLEIIKLHSEVAND